MKHQIKHHYTKSVLFECDLPDDTPSGSVTRHLLEKATADGARLDGASLIGASLDGASLIGARLIGARLIGARLDGARLDGARLIGARLDGASLIGASLDGASLIGASLDGASLDGARLDGASLIGASLDGASLDGASLIGARLDGALLVGERPIFQIGPIGSRCAYFMVYLTTEGVKLRAGCFFGTVDKFTAKLSEEHGDNIHAKEYRAALDLIQCHAGLWTPPTP